MLSSELIDYLAELVTDAIKNGLEERNKIVLSVEVLEKTASIELSNDGGQRSNPAKFLAGHDQPIPIGSHLGTLIERKVSADNRRFSTVISVPLLQSGPSHE